MANTALRLIEGFLDSDKSPGNAPANIDVCDIGHGFHYWQGKSGERYLHSVYDLKECPELPMANYIIVRRDENCERTALFIGQTKEIASSLNLAHIRQRAARMGGNEIHIHVLTDSCKQRFEVERDLLKGQFVKIEKRLRAMAANNSDEHAA